MAKARGRFGFVGRATPECEDAGAAEAEIRDTGWMADAWNSSRGQSGMKRLIAHCRAAPWECAAAEPIKF